MKKDKKNRKRVSMVRWLILQTLVIIGTVALSFISIELLADLIYGRRPGGQISPLALLMLVPLMTLMSLINFTLAKGAFSHVRLLSGAMEKAAKGQFETRLDTYHRGSMEEVYRNFNAMCEELQQVRQLRSDFANSYSHEFKTPIVSISGFAELLLQNELPQEEQRQYLKIIRDESSRLAYLADNTLLLSKLDATVILSEKQSYLLDEQIRECVVALAKQWCEKGIEFSGELQPVLYNGNEELMRQLWLNLIGNAVKYTASNGFVAIALKQENHSAVVNIQDNGVGMTQEQTRHIFEKYYQVETGNNKQGIGLGLSIVKRILELCDGSITVETTPGKGSCFTVRIPL